jgi:hypothetical protein
LRIRSDGLVDRIVVTLKDDVLVTYGTLSAAAVATTGVVTIVIDGGGSVPPVGVKAPAQLPTNGTITGWSVIADQSGSCTYAGAFGQWSNYIPNLTMLAEFVTALVTHCQSGGGANKLYAVEAWNEWNAGNFLDPRATPSQHAPRRSGSSRSKPFHNQYQGSREVVCRRALRTGRHGSENAPDLDQRTTSGTRPQSYRGDRTT